ncbi:ATP-dependent nuclease [Desulfoferula mesophila]|uniref:ATP-dependent endonuclease of the OLD family n=1 Tax=Desulfoferula mesophila TaxID=3058419 RepID=A0AAU9ED53_9BACT|nr:hypothetical protein FAK_21290 [Desulfoferula mesophilus]
MKLKALTITNFAGIGEPGITVPIDDIVVLIGPNNSGKSSVLDAYEAFANTGAALPVKSFHNEDPHNTVEIIGIFTEITDDDREALSSKWEYQDTQFGHAMKLKWEWANPEQGGLKYSWNPEKGEWVKGGMGGWDTLITSRIPVPLRIKPTDDHEITEKQIIDILTSAAKAALKKDGTKANKVLSELQSLADSFVKEVQEDLDDVCKNITNKINPIFPGHKVEFQQSIGKIDPDKIISTGSHIRISEPDKDSIPLSHQGAGMRRTFLWSSLGTLAEMGKVKQKKTAIPPERQRILLIEEPESFLHPPMIRSARDALYQLAEIAEWQVMTCTHSPIFIDVSKPHTTILRIEKKTFGSPRVFRSSDANFSEDDREQLRMVRSCHPTVAEFFFADTVLLVEGETEHAIFTYLMSQDNGDSGHWCHVVNCMGKPNIPLFAKILNQFGTPYTIIHDTDSPKVQRSGKWIASGMWTINKRIAEVVGFRDGKLPPCSLLAHIPDFEGYYFGEKIKSNKPYHAISKVRSAEFQASPKFAELLNIIHEPSKCDHAGIYSSYNELKVRVKDWVSETKPAPPEAWEIED